MKSLYYLITGIVGLIYILNPTAGTLELIPDMIPIIGNLDEFAASALILASLVHFKNRFFPQKSTKKPEKK